MRIRNRLESNAKTIGVYNHEVNNYVQNTPHSYLPHHDAMLRWIQAALACIPKQVPILEIGSATPRDANFMRSRGYSVQCSDAAQGFVRYMSSIGDDAILLNVLSGPIPQGYGMIFANAVAPHFTVTELDVFLEKCLNSLPDSGILAFNLKIGEGNEWVQEKMKRKRFMQYWDPEEVHRKVTQLPCNIIFFDIGALGDHPNHNWVNIVLQKA